MKRLLNQMKLYGAMVASTNNTSTRFGVVDSYDPDNYCCKVILKPEDTMTGWLPITSPWVGNGWGLFMPPSIGDVVDVHFQEGDPDAGYVSLRFYDDESRPVHCESGVFYLIHKSGSAMKFNNDGTVDLITHSDLRVTVGGAMTTTVTNKSSTTANKVDIDGGTGGLKGIVQGDCLCAYSGKPHPMVSGTVKGSI